MSTEVKCAFRPQGSRKRLAGRWQTTNQFRIILQGFSEVQEAHGLEAPGLGVQFSQEEMALLRLSEEIVQKFGEKSAA